MAAIHSDEFKRDAVRIATTSGLTRRQVASDLGIGFLTLSKWMKAVADEAGPPGGPSEWFFRFFISDHFSHHAIHLNDRSEIPRPPLIWTSGPNRFILDPIHLMLGLNTYEQTLRWGLADPQGRFMVQKDHTMRKYSRPSILEM